MKKKFGPIEVNNEEKPDIAPYNVFMDQLMKLLGVSFLLVLGIKSIHREPIDTYGPVAGWLLIVTMAIYIFRKLRTTTKKDIMQFTNRFIRIERNKHAD